MISTRSPYFFSKGRPYEGDYLRGSFDARHLFHGEFQEAGLLPTVAIRVEAPAGPLLGPFLAINASLTSVQDRSCHNTQAQTVDEHVASALSGFIDRSQVPADFIRSVRHPQGSSVEQIRISACGNASSAAEGRVHLVHRCLGCAYDAPLDLPIADLRFGDVHLVQFAPGDSCSHALLFGLQVPNFSLY